MARKRAPTSESQELPPPKLQGKTFVFARKKNDFFPEREYTQLITAQGGKVVRDVTAGLDFVVLWERCPTGKWGAVKQAEQLNQKKGASIQILDRDAFGKLVAPTRAELLAFLR